METLRRANRKPGRVAPPRTTKEQRRYTLNHLVRKFATLDPFTREVFISREAMADINFEQMFVISELKQEYGYTIHLNREKLP